MLVLVFLTIGLTAVSAVDADNDPTTTNVPSVVLAVEVRVPADDDARHLESEPGVLAGRRKFATLARRLGERLGVAQDRWRRRVRPIRGP